MPFEHPQSFWPTLYRLAGGQTWPPQSHREATLFLVRVVSEGLLSLLMEETKLPPAVSVALQDFKALDRANRLRAHVFEDSLRLVIDVLEGESVAILKGTDYAYRFYPAPHLRPRQDIDILVPRDRAAGVQERLRKAGFKQHYLAGALGRLPSYHEVEFEIGKATLDVHHSFIQRTRNRVDYAGVWKRMKPWSGFDSRLLRLDDVDALLYHAINMSSEEFSNPSFRHLDLWLMLRHNEDILPAAVSRAHQWRTTRPLYGALRQASRYFPEMQTPAVEKAMRELLPSHARRFLDRSVLPDPWLPGKSGRARHLWRKFWLIDDSLHRTWFALYHVYAVVAGKLLELRDGTAPSQPGKSMRTEVEE